MLEQGVLLLLGHVFSRVEFVLAGLAQRNHKALSEAAAHQNRHDAEVEHHRALGIHPLHARNSLVVVFAVFLVLIRSH